MIRILVIAISLILPILSFGQKENNFWFLNTGIGLDFNRVVTGPGGSPEVKDFDPSSYTISSSEFVSYCDESGNLLFYSNGQSVWNADHEYLLNGDDLISVNGGADVQEALAVRVSCTRYLLFYQVFISGAQGRLLYSEIDMELDDGLGGIVDNQKDILLNSQPYRAFSVVQGLGNNWLVGVLQKSEEEIELHAYKINPKSIDPPVVTALEIDDLRGLNYSISFSADGKLLCFNQGGLLFDGLPMFVLSFDKAVGTFKKMQKLVPEPPPWEGYNSNIISAQFSENSKYLYTVERYGYCEQLECFTGFAVFQFVYDDQRKEVRNSSKTELVFYEIEDPPIGEMRYTSNGKIYLNRFGHSFFDVIARPNDRNCAYQSERIKLTVGILPLWMPNTVLPAQDFQFIVNEDLAQPIPLCEGKVLSLEISDCYDSVLWFDNSTDLTIQVEEAGIYWVEVTDGPCSFRQYFTVEEYASSKAYLPADTVLCSGDILEMDFSTETWADSLLWEDSSIDKVRNIDSQGTYHIDVIEDGCVNRDFIEVNYDLLPESVLSADTVKCAQKELRLRASAFEADYLWSTGERSSTIDILSEGLYTVTLTRGVCSMEDSILVDNRPDKDLIKVSDLEICVGESVDLDAQDSDIISYEWSTGNFTASIDTKEEGEITVIAFDDFCEFRDTVNISRFHCSDAVIYLPNTFSLNTLGINSRFAPGIPDNLTYISGYIEIYDRYGNLQILLDDAREGWDGRIDGKVATPGLYMAKIGLEVIDSYGEQELEFVQGVTLIE